MHPRLKLKNKNTKMSPKTIVDRSNTLFSEKQKKLHPDVSHVSQNPSYQNTSRVFDLTCKLSIINNLICKKSCIQILTHSL